MKMIQEMWNLLAGRMDFFGGLLLEHLEISLLAIAIAIVVGGFAGIVISEYSRRASSISFTRFPPSQCWVF